MSDGDSSSSRGSSTSEPSTPDDSGDSGGSDDNDSGGSDNNDSGGSDDSGGTGDTGGSGDTGDSGNADASLGSITLAWVPPSSRQDGSPISLSEIQGYEIHYGRQSGEYDEVVSLPPPGCNCYELTDLEQGTYYLAMRVEDVEGRLSGYSEEVTLRLD